VATKSRTKFDLKTVQTPFYAYVGVTDLAVEAVREVVADVQSRVRGYQNDVAKVDLQPKALREQAVTRVQSLVDDNVSALNDTYGDLVKRGESLVGRIRRQESTKQTVKSAETTVAKAKTTRTQASKATATTAKKAAKTVRTTAKKQGAPARSSAKATTTAAKKTANAATKAVSEAAAKIGD
jgi:heparin binding hemagglutinin HbhA